MKNPLEISALLDEVIKAAADLNELSRRATTLIDGVDKELLEARVGMEVWGVDFGTPVAKMTLGFSHVDNGMGLAYRPNDRRYGEPPPPAWSLRAAPRKVRLDSIQAIPALLELIAARLKEEYERGKQVLTL